MMRVSAICVMVSAFVGAYARAGEGNATDLATLTGHPRVPGEVERLAKHFDLRSAANRLRLTDQVSSALEPRERDGLVIVYQYNDSSIRLLWAMQTLADRPDNLHVLRNIRGYLSDPTYADSYSMVAELLSDTRELPITRDERMRLVGEPHRVCDKAFDILRRMLNKRKFLPDGIEDHVSTAMPLAWRDTRIVPLRRWWFEEGGREKVLANTRLLVEDILSEESPSGERRADAQSAEVETPTAEESAEPSPPGPQARTGVAAGAEGFAWIFLAIGLVVGAGLGAAGMWLILRRRIA